jgi:hypothetical protein
VDGSPVIVVEVVVEEPGTRIGSDFSRIELNRRRASRSPALL